MISAQDIRELLGSIESLSSAAPGLGEDEQLFDKGLDSFGSVQLMLALEDRYDIEFPDHLLNRRSFSTIRIICETVSMLKMQAAA